jgi:hypothetical protein
MFLKRDCKLADLGFASCIIDVTTDDYLVPIYHEVFVAVQGHSGETVVSEAFTTHGIKCLGGSFGLDGNSRWFNDIQKEFKEL